MPSEFFALPAADKVIVDLLMHGQQPSRIPRLIGRTGTYVKHRLAKLYERFGVPEELDPRVALVVFVHQHRHQFGVSCLECDAKNRIQ